MILFFVTFEYIKEIYFSMTGSKAELWIFVVAFAFKTLQRTLREYIVIWFGRGEYAINNVRLQKITRIKKFKLKKIDNVQIKIDLQSTLKYIFYFCLLIYL